MYDTQKAKAYYHKKLVEDPNFNKNLVEKWIKQMPEDFAKVMYEEEHGYHINDIDLYDEATSYFKNPDGSCGPHWTIESIKSTSELDFEETTFTLYDFCYVVNMIYSDYGEIIEEMVDSSNIAKMHLDMAEQYLTDSDYYGKACERAYCDAMKRIQYFEK